MLPLLWDIRSGLCSIAANRCADWWRIHNNPTSAAGSGSLWTQHIYFIFLWKAVKTMAITSTPLKFSVRLGIYLMGLWSTPALQRSILSDHLLKRSRVPGLSFGNINGSKISKLNPCVYIAYNENNQVQQWWDDCLFPSRQSCVRPARCMGTYATIFLEPLYSADIMHLSLTLSPLDACLAKVAPSWGAFAGRVGSPLCSCQSDCYLPFPCHDSRMLTKVCRKPERP